MWLLWLFWLVMYATITWRSLVENSSPKSECHPNDVCLGPRVSVGHAVALELSLLRQVSSDKDDEFQSNSPNVRNEWVPVPSCRLEFAIPETGKLPQVITTTNGTECQVVIPDDARVQSPDIELVKPLEARFALSDNVTGEHLGFVPFQLTRVIEKRPYSFWPASLDSGVSGEPPQVRNLLSTNSTASSNHTVTNQGKIQVPTFVPYLKYGRAHLRIRFVAEDRPYGPLLLRADGVRLPRWNASTYAPVVYVDDLSLQRSAQIQLAPPPASDRPPVSLHVKVSSLAPIWDSLNRGVHQAFEQIDTMFSGNELDELRFYLRDEYLYRFLLTQIISYLHLFFDYMAFRDEIQFYRGRTNLSGVSTSSAVTSFMSSVIIFLYLIDGGGTSWVVLWSLFGSCCVSAWKVWRLLSPKLSTSFPFVTIRQFQPGSKEHATAEYDRIAVVNLAMVLYPLVIGWSLFALRHYQYKSWWSWFISNLANAVYTFGFVTLCPQLYVNYRLKSVAHLPWKVFMYKIFNTFVDDAFAWLIEMPWKHRIMTLRDDVVFLLFLVQFYLYRVDKTRTNEYGYAYEEQRPQLETQGVSETVLENEAAGKDGDVDHPEEQVGKEKVA
eukprot:Nitzschia sp. Nitz4//scaffold164_size50480//20593//22419//NITZ4_007003-RA/size50480-processed-gene-0.76-mRNA-1//-1//CDS//3329538077//5091//frame0